MQAIIIAGGFGTRLRPVTDYCPKPALPIMGRPFLDYQLELLKRIGVKRVVFSLMHLADRIIQIFGDGSQYGMEFFYAVEETPLGTGGGIKNCEQYLTHDPVIVFNGDVLCDIDLSDVVKFHHDKKAKITLTMTPVKDPTIYGVIFTDRDERIQKFLEKPKLEEVTQNTISAGIYIYERDVFERIPPNTNYSVEHQLYPSMLDAGQPMYGFRTESYWLDIGTPQKFLQAHWDFMDGKIHLPCGGKQVHQGIWVGRELVPEQEKVLKRPNLKPPLFIGYGAQFDGESELGPYVVLYENVKLRGKMKASKTIFLDYSSAHGDAEVENTIVHYQAEILDGAKIKDVGIYTGQ